VFGRFIDYIFKYILPSASYITLLEAGVDFEPIKLNLRTDRQPSCFVDFGLKDNDFLLGD
jgi:hypothetical protein